jgi:hypothetical protein
MSDIVRPNLKRFIKTNSALIIMNDNIYKFFQKYIVYEK